MKRILLASVGLLAMAGALGPAAAADLPRQMVTKGPAYVAPFYNWTGLYVGLNAGYGWGTSSWDGVSTGNFDVNGGLIGGTIGYNWQFGQTVLGIEADLDWSGIDGSTSAGACAGLPCRTQNDWLSTVRGRVGYAADRWMPYLTGGLALGNIKATNPGFVGVDTTRAGWTLGAGLEFALAGNWTAKAEYLYVDLGSTGCTTPCGLAANNVSFTTNIFRGGLNYRF